MYTSSLKDPIPVDWLVTFLLQWVQNRYNFELSPSNCYHYYHFSFFVRFGEMIFLELYCPGLKAIRNRNIIIEI